MYESSNKRMKNAKILQQFHFAWRALPISTFFQLKNILNSHKIWFFLLFILYLVFLMYI